MLNKLCILKEVEKLLISNCQEKSSKKYPSGASLKSKISESGVILTAPLIRSSGLIVVGAWNWLNVKLGKNEISEKVIFQKFFVFH